jgi:hypothetical protein
MRLDRLPYEPGELAGFYEEGFAALGALCERTWHDRLEVVAQGEPAKLWNAEGGLHEVELSFSAPDITTARDPAREVFPGCPLTFHLAEALLPRPLTVERVALANEGGAHPPDPQVGEKLWRAQFTGTNRWRLKSAFKAEPHFSLLALVRCEIQAIDQHWSLRRIAVSLSDDEPDTSLAESIAFAQVDVEAAGGLVWPPLEPARWNELLTRALQVDLADELAAIRTRQENYLRRELDRIDDYFENYERELNARAAHSSSETAKAKLADRLAAARGEHARRRADQVARHEIRVRPHPDALLLIAEPAWRATLEVEAAHQFQALDALFVPRCRRWFTMLTPPGG